MWTFVVPIVIVFYPHMDGRQIHLQNMPQLPINNGGNGSNANHILDNQVLDRNGGASHHASATRKKRLFECNVTQVATEGSSDGSNIKRIRANWTSSLDSSLNTIVVNHITTIQTSSPNIQLEKTTIPWQTITNTFNTQNSTQFHSSQLKNRYQEIKQLCSSHTNINSTNTISNINSSSCRSIIINNNNNNNNNNNDNNNNNTSIADYRSIVLPSGTNVRFTSTEVDILKKSHEKAKSSSTGNVRWGTVLNYFLDFCKREKFTKTHSLVYDRSCEALESKWKEMKKKSM